MILGYQNSSVHAFNLLCKRWPNYRLEPVVIDNYDPKEIEDLLNKVSKHRLCKDLGISIKSLENYIKLHQIQYTKPKIKRRLVERL